MPSLILSNGLCPWRHTNIIHVKSMEQWNTSKIDREPGKCPANLNYNEGYNGGTNVTQSHACIIGLGRRFIWICSQDIFASVLKIYLHQFPRYICISSQDIFAQFSKYICISYQDREVLDMFSFSMKLSLVISSVLDYTTNFRVGTWYWLGFSRTNNLCEYRQFSF